MQASAVEEKFMEAAGGGFRSREIGDAEIKVPSVTNPATATVSLLLLLFCFVLLMQKLRTYSLRFLSCYCNGSVI